jgi:hypothetical protein
MLKWERERLRKTQKRRKRRILSSEADEEETTRAKKQQNKREKREKQKIKQHNNMSISDWNQGFFCTSIFGYQIFGKLFPQKKLAKFISPIKTKNGIFFCG